MLWGLHLTKGHFTLFSLHITHAHARAHRPASSPYVTSVGGTYLSTARTVSKYRSSSNSNEDAAEEIGWSDSGGGFSAVFVRPQYQDIAVSRYISSTTLPSAELFNASGRATPDVSALATNYRVLSSGAYGCLSGTSAATPVFAGIISRINSMLLEQGKPTVGCVGIR